MKKISPQPLELFYCYSQKDRALRDELDIHLAGLRHSDLITTWYDGEIIAGTEWQEAIRSHLNAAHLILLLVSPDFISSEYCYGVEMQQAIKRHDLKEARVVPIILRHIGLFNWRNAPFGKLQALPRNGIPVESSSWHNHDEAFAGIADEIEKVVDELIAIQSDNYREAHVGKGNALLALKRYEEALAAYHEALKYPPISIRTFIGMAEVLNHLKRNEEALAICEQALLKRKEICVYNNKGWALNALQRYDEALVVCEQALWLDSANVRAWNDKSWALNGLGRHQEALKACEEAIRFVPEFAPAHDSKGWALNGLKRHEEALIASQRAIDLDPTFAPAFNGKSWALNELNRYEEALAASQRAIDLDPTFAPAYHNKGLALVGLQRYEEALAAYNQAIRLHPKDAQAHYRRGSVLERLAQQSYEKARLLEWPNQITMKSASGMSDGVTPDGIGLFWHFSGASVYWSPETGAHEVHGAIRDKWKELGWEQGFLGYPVTDEILSPDNVGRLNHFQHGSIYWSPETGAHEVHGEIREKWAALGWECGLLGYPVTDEIDAPDGASRVSYFQHGSIYWSSQTGTVVKDARGDPYESVRTRTAIKDAEGNPL